MPTTRTLVSGKLFTVVFNETVTGLSVVGNNVRPVYGKHSPRLVNRYCAYLTPDGEIELVPLSVRKPTPVEPEAKRPPLARVRIIERVRIREDDDE